MKQPQTTHTRHPMTRQHGLSMVELMVAITISLLLLAGVIQIFLATRQTYTLQDGMSRLQENARYALDRITREISASGYLGCAESFDPEAIDNLLTIQTGAFDYSTPISADNNTGIDNTDVLYVRFGSSGGLRLTDEFDTDSTQAFIDSTDPNYQALEQYDILSIGDCDGVTVIMITNDPETSNGTIEFNGGIVATSGPNQGQSNLGGALDTRTFQPDVATGSLKNAFRTTSNIYLVGPSFSGNGNALFVNSIAPDNELIQGVEDFQVTVGVNDDNDLGADRYVDPDNVVADDWRENVVSVRLSLRLNTVDPVQGGATINKTFTTTVRLRNRGNVT